MLRTDQSVNTSDPTDIIQAQMSRELKSFKWKEVSEASIRDFELSRLGITQKVTEKT